MNTVTVDTIDTWPSLDPYHRDTGGETYTAVKIDPDKRMVWAEQENRDGATPADEWHNRVLVFVPEYRPDEKELHDYLRSDNAQELLGTVCDGFEVIWDGHNQVGRLEKEAEAAWETLTNEISNLPESSVELWNVFDWLAPCNLSTWGLTPSATDEQIAKTVKEIESDAIDTNVVLYGGIEEWLREQIEKERDNAE